ncbi:hypothetical protein NQ317_010768 [Molorchus minor]|uniref:Uncharacterized protein n=1 Tax=Molorchus minor TaxID=1323400 RepID=A0ABQ9J5K1_9CUCU|nr:hypothetical protein NQ317_010768 [Molorchus minor]
MSPASSGNLEVERYIGACLISQHRSKNSAANNKVRNEHNIFARGRDHYIPPDFYQHHVNFGLQRCQAVDGWAGGMPLVSFANNQRRGRRNEADGGADQQTCSPLARLAVHTQGAPLILTKSYNHRKNKVHRNNGVPSTKMFDNSNAKKQNKCQEQQNGASNSAGVDAVSVTSDESSGSANSENCLPRIIKPRKRRKKDRKPPLLGRPLSQDGFSTDSASPDIDNNPQGNPYGSYRLSDPSPLLDRRHILNDISETPKLHHSFEDIEELDDDSKDVNGNQQTSTCQCRYCDPSGQIWDVDRNCYSPFLTPPNNNHTKTFQFPNLNLDASYTAPISPSESGCLVRGMSTVSLEGDESKKAPPSRSSSSSSCRDLEVSTEIVTSLNGHRDLEIRFFSLASVDSAGKG